MNNAYVTQRVKCDNLKPIQADWSGWNGICKMYESPTSTPRCSGLYFSAGIEAIGLGVCGWWNNVPGAYILHMYPDPVVGAAQLLAHSFQTWPKLIYQQDPSQ